MRTKHARHLDAQCLQIHAAFAFRPPAAGVASASLQIRTWEFLYSFSRIACLKAMYAGMLNSSSSLRPPHPRLSQPYSPNLLVARLPSWSVVSGRQAACQSCLCPRPFALFPAKSLFVNICVHLSEASQPQGRRHRHRREDALLVKAFAGLRTSAARAAAARGSPWPSGPPPTVRPGPPTVGRA